MCNILYYSKLYVIYIVSRCVDNIYSYTGPLYKFLLRAPKMSGPALVVKMASNVVLHVMLCYIQLFKVWTL
jgi:hypothetical protein